MSKIALLFPGQGSQKPGMGRELYENNAAARAIFERADEALGFSLSQIMFNGSEAELTKTEIAQPAILTHSIAAFACLNLSCQKVENYEQSEQNSHLCGISNSSESRCHISTETKSQTTSSTVSVDSGMTNACIAENLYSYVGGHSLGEFSALVAAETLSFEDAVRIVHYRGKVMQEAVPLGEGAMAAIVGLASEAIENECRKISQTEGSYVVAANFNGELQTVISGTAQGVREASIRLKECGAKLVVPLNVSAPFHCELMRPAQDKLEAFLEKIEFNDAKVPVVCNVLASAVTQGDEIKRLMVRQVTSPVQFTRMLAFLIAAGAETFIEIGPGKNLSGIIRRFAKNCSVFNIENYQDLVAHSGRLGIK